MSRDDDFWKKGYDGRFPEDDKPDSDADESDRGEDNNGTGHGINDESVHKEPDIEGYYGPDEDFDDDPDEDDDYDDPYDDCDDSDDDYDIPDEDELVYTSREEDSDYIYEPVKAETYRILRADDDRELTPEEVLALVEEVERENAIISNPDGAYPKDRYPNSDNYQNSGYPGGGYHGSNQYDASGFVDDFLIDEPEMAETLHFPGIRGETAEEGSSPSGEESGKILDFSPALAEKKKQEEQKKSKSAIKDFYNRNKSDIIAYTVCVILLAVIFIYAYGRFKKEAELEKKGNGINIPIATAEIATKEKASRGDAATKAEADKNTK